MSWIADPTNYTWYEVTQEEDIEECLLDPGLEVFDTEIEAVEMLHGCVLGEHAELERLLGILCRRFRGLRNKNNEEMPSWDFDIVETIVETRVGTIRAATEKDALAKAYNIWVCDGMFGPNEVSLAVEDRSIAIDGVSFDANVEPEEDEE